MKKTYAWKRSMSLNAEVAGTIFERITKERGKLIPAYLVEEARPDQSPLHNLFEWDDTIAAQLHREEQARSIIRCHVVLLCPDETKKEDVPIQVNASNSTRSFVNIRQPNGEKNYVAITVVMEDDAMREQYIRRAYQELNDWAIRYKSITAFAEIIGMIKKTNLNKILAVK